MAGKVFIDKDRCVGCSICNSVCPEVFAETKKDSKYNGDFKCFIDNNIDPEKFADKIQEAIGQCPVNAIKLRGGKSNVQSAKAMKSATKGRKARAKSRLKIVLCTVPLNLDRDRGAGQYPQMPKVAIISIMKWLEKAGYSSDFYDIDTLLPSDKKILDYFKEKKPDVVGVSAVVSSSYLQVKRISKIIREACPGAQIVLGGYMASSANILLRKTDVNICVLGDGEDPFVSFLDYIEKNRKTVNGKELSKIKGLAFLNDKNELEITGYGETKINNPHYYPDYDIMTKGCIGNHGLMKKTFFRETKKCAEFNRDPRTYEPHRKPMMSTILSTKGCVARCTFCQRFSRGYWTSNLEALDRYLKNVKEKYNVGSILIGDENFGSDKKYAYETAKLMKKHDMLWFAGGARVNSFTHEDIKFFRDNGCTAIKFGVESGSQKILNIMEKKITVNNLVTALKSAKDCGLYSSLGFCLGMPGETNETIIETGKFIGEIARMRGMSPKNIFMDLPYAMPFPGTPLYQYAQLRGVVGTSVDEEEKYLTWVSDKSPTKKNFVNLSGASMKDALFWEFLTRYEAMRTYYSKPLDEKTAITGPTIKGKKVERETIIKTAISGMTFKTFTRYLSNPITTLNNMLVCSRLVAKFPNFLRSPFYSIMKNLIYAEFKIKNGIRGYKGFSSRKIGVVKEIEEGEGLRLVVKKLKEELPEQKALTEKNVDILLQGR